MASPFPCCPVNRECHVKENPDKKLVPDVSTRHLKGVRCRKAANDGTPKGMIFSCKIWGRTRIFQISMTTILDKIFGTK